MAKAALDENYLISISGIVTFKTAGDLKETVRKLPLESLIVETDSPYLAPVPYRGKKNEPKYVSENRSVCSRFKRYSLRGSVRGKPPRTFIVYFQKANPQHQLQLGTE